MEIESVITHPKAPLVIVRSTYINICQQAPDARCAAAILSDFEFWTNVKINNMKQQEIENTIAARGGIHHDPPDVWIWKTQADLKEELLGLFGSNKVRDNLAWLIEVDYLEFRNNPKYAWDRTGQYRLNIEKVQAVLDGGILELTHASVKNNKSSDPNQQIEDDENNESNALNQRSNTIDHSINNNIDHLIDDSSASDDAVDDAIADDGGEGEPNENERSEPEQSGKKRDPIFDAIKAGWGVDQGSFVGRIKKLLTGHYIATGVKAKDNRNRPWIEANIEPGMDADEIKSFVKWYRAHNESASFPLSPEKIQLHVYKFRADPSLPGDDEPIPESHRLFRAEDKKVGKYKKQVDEMMDNLMALTDADFVGGFSNTYGD